MKTHRVQDIHGDQIQVDGQWFHAERVFGAPASQFKLDQVVEALAGAIWSDGLAQVSTAGANAEPDEYVTCALFRGCSSNEMDPAKTEHFAAVMTEAGSWGPFPMVAGYIHAVEASDVAQCAELVEEGRSSIWLSELGWSRLLTDHDIGLRYVHLDNGHHRMSAAARASEALGPILVPVADLHREEQGPRYAAIRP